MSTNDSVLAEYVTQAELANQLGKAPRTLKRWHAKRYGPQPIRLGKSLLYRSRDVVAWLNQQPPATHADVLSGSHASHKPPRSRQGA